MRTALKNLPRLKLGDLLRRRKMTLKQLLDEFAITTYEALVIRCDRMGVLPPAEEEFKAVAKPPVNSPQEGVVVLEAPPVIDELTGRSIDPDAPVLPEVKVITDAPAEADLEPTEQPQKKPRKKKDNQPSE